MKKKFVLVVLFVLPLVVYMFFASGITRFGRLPVLAGPVDDLAALSDSVRLDDRITVLVFLGDQPQAHKGNLFNLNQKIYKRFREFEDFQLVVLAASGTEAAMADIRKELAGLAEVSGWKFVFADTAAIRDRFRALGTGLPQDPDGYSPYVFILDKDRMLRGRNRDEDQGLKYGFDATSVADLNNKMEDDMKIILAEYRLALKRNSAFRSEAVE